MREYKEVKVKDLFVIRRGEKLAKPERIKGTVPLVTSARYGNGVAEWIEPRGMTVFNCGCITVNSFGFAFFHDYKICADDHVVILENQIMQDSVKLYITGVIDKTIKEIGFDYFNRFRVRDAEKLVIKLPVDEYGTLDFCYMENYIKSLQTEIFANAA